MAIDYSVIFEKLKDGKGKFIYSILTKWYVLAALPAIAVTYNVLSGMSGTLDKIYKEVEETLNMIEVISTKCPALIEDLDQFFNCIGF
jgi:hypothetical protein